MCWNNRKKEGNPVTITTMRIVKVVVMGLLVALTVLAGDQTAGAGTSNLTQQTIAQNGGGIYCLSVERVSDLIGVALKRVGNEPCAFTANDIAPMTIHLAEGYVYTYRFVTGPGSFFYVVQYGDVKEAYDVDALTVRPVSALSLLYADSDYSRIVWRLACVGARTKHGIFWRNTTGGPHDYCIP